ncbi:MAG: SRPBCC family protein [Pseudonocardia sp.]
MTRVELAVPVEVGVPAAVLWRSVTDWEHQGEWMLATTVRRTGGDGRSPGSTWSAATGVGPLAVVDTIELVELVEGGPWRATVRHTGKVVRGDGIFTVEALGPARSRFTVAEHLDLPGGLLGLACRSAVRTVGWLGLEVSLRRLARRVEAEHAARA